MKLFFSKKFLFFIYPVLYLVMLIWFLYVIGAFTHMCEPVYGATIGQATVLLGLKILVVPLILTVPIIIGIGAWYKKVFRSFRAFLVASLLMLIPILWFLIFPKMMPTIKSWLILDKIGYPNSKERVLGGTTTNCGFPDALDSSFLDLKTDDKPEGVEGYFKNNVPDGFRLTSNSNSDQNNRYIEYRRGKEKILISIKESDLTKVHIIYYPWYW